MKLVNVSFGLGSLSVVNRGAKVVANVAPQLIALSTKGGFAITRWLIGKAYAKKTKTGAPVMTTVRMTNEEKEELLASQSDTIVAENRETLIEKFELSADASDEEIKSHLTINDIASPETQAFVGAKVASNGNTPGVGLKLTFSYTSTWEQLKSDLDDKTAVKRVFDVDIKNSVSVKMNNGFEDVDVVLYSVGDYVDEKPSRIGNKEDADADAQAAE